MAAVAGRPRLVALRALGLGDLLTAVPALRALARAFPAHERVLAAPRALAPLAELIGAVDRVADTEPLGPLAPGLHGPDVAVNLHGRGPQSHAVLLAAAPARLLAFANAEVPASTGLPEWRPHEHEVARWCRMLAGCGVAADPGDLAIAPPAEPAPPLARGATVIHPGAASGARRWPPERFAAVARHELAEGRRVVVTGGPHELRLARAVARGACGRADGDARLLVRAGRTSLAQLAALVAAAERVVCGDTGVGHLATALGIPSVLLFGPTSPAEWGPPPERAIHRVLWAGRTGDPHAEVPDPDGLLRITSDDVVAALAGLPRGDGGPPHGPRPVPAATPA